MQSRSTHELIAECEKYANCVFKYETDADTIFMNHFVLARGYSALGEHEKAKEILGKIPVTFGDRFYWEAEIAQANREYDDAMLKCRSSFALKARYICRCIRMAGEIRETTAPEDGIAQRLAYEEYMLRMLNAFLSGGNYLPCRQIYQKHILLRSMVWRYLQLKQIDAALEKAEMLFAGRLEFLDFLEHRDTATSLLFENNDPPEYQRETKHQLDCYVQDTAGFLRAYPESDREPRIRKLLEKFHLNL